MDKDKDGLGLRDEEERRAKRIVLTEFEYQHSTVCSRGVEGVIGGECENGTVVDSQSCTRDGVDVASVEPVQRRYRSGGAWEYIALFTCPGEYTWFDFTIEDFKRVGIDSAGAVRQPGAKGLVNMPVIVHSPTTVQVFETEVLGRAVHLAVEAVEYSWDFGDGGWPLVTASPGKPYPSEELTHTYLTPGTRQITLTTTWDAFFRVEDEPEWRQVDGTLETTSEPFTHEVVERRTHLLSPDR